MARSHFIQGDTENIKTEESKGVESKLEFLCNFSNHFPSQFFTRRSNDFYTQNARKVVVVEVVVVYRNASRIRMWMVRCSSDSTPRNPRYSGKMPSIIVRATARDLTLRTLLHFDEEINQKLKANKKEIHREKRL